MGVDTRHFLWRNRACVQVARPIVEQAPLGSAMLTLARPCIVLPHDDEGRCGPRGYVSRPRSDLRCYPGPVHALLFSSTTTKAAAARGSRFRCDECVCVHSRGPAGSVIKIYAKV